MRPQPTFTIFCGPMWSGKTVALLSYVDKCKYQRKSVIAFKPKVDDRYSTTEIVSHGGWKLPAHAVANAEEIIKVLAESTEVYDVIAIDEMFMIPGVADILIWAFRSGITVVAATIDLDASGKALAEVKAALPWATKVVKCTAACVLCGRDARYTYRKRGADEQGAVQVGGEEAYEPRCFSCHPDVSDSMEPVNG